MIDNKFCEFLEYEICKAFKSSHNEELRGFWCDGVHTDQSDYFYSQKFVNDNRQVKLKAFIGRDGQEEYELTLKFGNKALNRYAKNLNVKECVPSLNKQNWFEIDTIQNRIVIQLD